MAKEEVVDAYAQYVEEKRKRYSEAPPIEVRPNFTEEEANMLAALIEQTKPQFKVEVRSKLTTALAKLDTAIGRAREEVAR